jgi:hypothetical protein
MFNEKLKVSTVLGIIILIALFPVLFPLYLLKWAKL